MIAWLISITTYLFIGGFINGLYSEPDEEMNFAATFFWPIVLVLWLGDELGKFIRSRF